MERFANHIFLQNQQAFIRFDEFVDAFINLLNGQRVQKIFKDVFEWFSAGRSIPCAGDVSDPHAGAELFAKRVGEGKGEFAECVGSPEWSVAVKEINQSMLKTIYTFRRIPPRCAKKQEIRKSVSPVWLVRRKKGAEKS